MSMWPQAVHDLRKKGASGVKHAAVLAPLRWVAGSAFAQGSWIPKVGGRPWYDRVNQWQIGKLPDKYARDKPIPQQSCTARTLELRAPGARQVTIAISKQQSRDEAAGATGKTKEARTAVPATEQEFVAQEWPFQPGERKVKMHVERPSNGINGNTGMMLVLHNWGGRYNEPHYVAWCREFADRYNVVAASVNYLQSGDGEPQVVGEKPYDHGYLQAMDCIRALYHLQKQLQKADVTFNPHRVYAMGGSGGGNVTLMANKVAPHTFACVVDICGMPGLTDGIAYGTGEYGSQLNAGYSRDPRSPAYLTKDMQRIRDPGDPEHLKLQYQANPKNKVVIVHGLDDTSCPVVHKITIFRNMVAAGFRPDGHFLTPWSVDGEAVTCTTHAVGNRDKVVERFADAYMLEQGKFALETPGPNDFERAEKVVFPTREGRYIVDYSDGPPTISFEPTNAGG